MKKIILFFFGMFLLVTVCRANYESIYIPGNGSGPMSWFPTISPWAYPMAYWTTTVSYVFNDFPEDYDQVLYVSHSLDTSSGTHMGFLSSWGNGSTDIGWLNHWYPTTREEDFISDTRVFLNDLYTQKEVNTNVFLIVSGQNPSMTQDADAYLEWGDESDTYFWPKTEITFTFTYGMGTSWHYQCYFDLEGVTFFDNMTNKMWSSKLYVSTDGSDFDLMDTYSHTVSESYLDSYGPYDLTMPDMGKKIVWYRWVVTAGPYGDETLGTWETDSSKPNNYHYVVEFDHVEYSTNLPPYDPPAPPDDPVDPTIPQPPGYDPYPPTNAPPYPWTNWPAQPPQWPPNYYPWPPDYPPPPPLTNWPSMPPDYWDYNPDNPNTNVVYPPVPDPSTPTNYPDDGSVSNMSLNDLYSIFRAALSDEGNSYQAGNPPDYVPNWTNDLLAKAQVVCDAYDLARGRAASNRVILITDSIAVLTDSAAGLSLPTTIGTKSGFPLTFPFIDEEFNLDLTPYDSIISIMRSFLKWMMYVSCFWIAFLMIRRALGRSA